MQNFILKISDTVVLPLFSILVSFILSGLIILALGENPFMALKHIFMGVFAYEEGIGYTLYYATNFIFTGLAVSLAFYGGMFNIGAEGQAYVAGLGATLVILALESVLPSVITILFGILGAMAFGAFWGFIPGYLKAKRGAHEVIVTIMLNFIASSVILYIIVAHLIVSGQSVESSPFTEGIRLIMMHDIVKWFGFKTVNTPLNISFVWALLVAFAVWVYIFRTRWGYNLRTLGKSENIAKYAGIRPTKSIIITMCISGALASGVAINQVIGIDYRLIAGFVNGAGFVGIAVALIGRNHPLGIVLASVLFGILYQGGTEMNFENPNISKDMVLAIQGLIVLFAGALPLLFKPVLYKLLGAK